VPTDTMNPATAVTWGPFIQAAYDQYTSDPGQPNPAGKQAAGRVGFFLQVEDFDAAYPRMASAGVQFLTAPRTEPYGRVAVFLDIAGGKMGPYRSCGVRLGKNQNLRAKAACRERGKGPTVGAHGRTV
jgi:hypothetical protein